MINAPIKNILRFVIVVLIQVLVFNNMNLSGYIHPYIYILFLLLLPIYTNRSVLLLLAFFTGLTIDYFAGTMGLNAAASVFLGYVRPGTIRLFFGKQDFGNNEEPGLQSFGAIGFLKYTVILVFLHQFLLYYLEVLSFDNFFYTFSTVIISTFVVPLLYLLVCFCSEKGRASRLVYVIINITI